MILQALASLMAIARAASQLVLAAASLVTVQGTSDCPSPADVAALLPGMLAPAAEVRAEADGEAEEEAKEDAEIASIDAAGSDLLITVRGSDGGIRLTRRIVRPDGSAGACPALAAAVAVVIATWKIERNVELSLLQPGVYPRPEASTTSARVEATARPGAGGPSAGEVAAPFVFPFVFLGAAVGTSVNQSGLAGTAQLEIGARPRGWRTGLWIALAADRERDQVVGEGTSTWRRMTAGLGPCWRLTERPVGVEIGAQLFAGRTTVAGSGFGVDRADHALSLGIDGMVRLVRPGVVQPFLEGGARGWLAPQDVVVIHPGHADSRVSLPRVEGRLTVGLRFTVGK